MTKRKSLDSFLPNEVDSLVVFIKNPKLGNVKTRLAKGAGKEKALKIYLSLLRFTQQLALSIDVNKYVFYSDHLEQDSWEKARFIQKTQIGEDLGQRMENALKEVLDDSRSAVLIGSDCPQLNQRILKKAFNDLLSHDIVLGPSLDGGYYLIGMNEVHSPVFKNVDWSSNRVFDQTMATIQRTGKKVSLLPTLSDIDYYEDWIKFGWNI